jgi:hypothetical protein
MRRVIRASVELSRNGYLVVLKEEDDSVWLVLDIAEGDSIVEVVRYLDNKHDLSSAHVLVLDNENEWTEPDCLTLAEALECTI